jgi:hypothetical protein
MTASITKLCIKRHYANAIMPSIIMLNVIMPSVVAPCNCENNISWHEKWYNDKNLPEKNTVFPSLLKQLKNAE